MFIISRLLCTIFKIRTLTTIKLRKCNLKFYNPLFYNSFIGQHLNALKRLNEIQLRMKIVTGSYLSIHVLGRLNCPSRL